MKIVIFLIVLSIILIILAWHGQIDIFYSFFKYPLKSISLVIPRNNSFQSEQKLLSLKTQLEETKRENILLRQQLDLKLRQNFKLILASVIGTGQAFLIDKNIENKPVIINNILIGRTENHGKVKLITDPQSKVAALIQETRMKGIVHGEHGLGLIMLLAPQEEVAKGQTVVTSGLNQEFPLGLVIGQIIDIQKNDNQTSQKARIQPFFNPKDLEKVFIITDY